MRTALLAGLLAVAVVVASCSHSTPPPPRPQQPGWTAVQKEQAISQLEPEYIPDQARCYVDYLSLHMPFADFGVMTSKTLDTEQAANAACGTT